MIAEKLFGGFMDLNNDPERRKVLYASQDGQQLAKDVLKQYQSAVKSCKSSNCLFRNLLISKEDSAAMVKLMEKSAVSLSTTHQASTSGSIAAMNYIIRTYLGAVPPRYPKIDAISFGTSDQVFADSVRLSVMAFLALPAAKASFFSLPMLTALKLLALNGRNEAARYHPVIAGTNLPAFERASKIEWDKFAFSAILVPGLGPQSATVALDAGGARRCDMAVEQFKAGVAPFIIVSGGHVHPVKTKYSEAVEMQRYLVNKHKIPQDAVIIEPYARHTTTNLRNASRLMYSFNLPETKPILIVTDVFQATYIPMMTGRFMEELGYLPYKNLVRNNKGQTSFLPDSAALQINPYDPLDP